MTDTPDNISPSLSKVSVEAREQLQAWAQKNRTTLEIFLDAYCIVDPDNRVVDFNVAFTELCGESYRKILKAKSFCDLLQTERCPKACPASEVISTGRAVRLDELTGASKAYANLQMILGAVPIHNDGGVCIGALLTIRNVSAETELQRKYHESKEESILDGLTQLYNKTYIENAHHLTIKASLRDGTPFTTVLTDIDHFKRVNDTYGHQAGDYVLTTVSQLLKAEARETDLVGRFGGEEFMLILPRTDMAGASIFCERFRKRVAETTFQFDGKNIPVTVSVGSSTFHKKWEAGVDIDKTGKELIGQADSALYFAKSQGRNQSRQFENLPSDSAHTGGKKAA